MNTFFSEETDKKIRTKNILVVDDEPGWRDLLSFELKDRGCEVTAVSNPEDALVCLRKNSFDLVITDVRMPGGMDGVDFIQAYAREKPDQKAIFITGYAEEEKLEQALVAGQRLCIKKPFIFDEFFELLVQLLSPKQ